uniref:Uncharacterized protein n=1 Tax=Micrurus lemniscatus lemniscatus TaxID=129467 RepID=A0A2D4JIG8_MICLE
MLFLVNIQRQDKLVMFQNVSSLQNVRLFSAHLSSPPLPWNYHFHHPVLKQATDLYLKLIIFFSASITAQIKGHSKLSESFLCLEAQIFTIGEGRSFLTTLERSHLLEVKIPGSSLLRDIVERVIHPTKTSRKKNNC